MRPSLSPQPFVTIWRKVELKERASAQEYFLDLCTLVGHAKSPPNIHKERRDA